MDYILALGLTLLVEIPLYSTGLRLILRTPPLTAARLALAANLIAHPIAYFLLFPSLAAPLGPIPAAATESLVMLAKWWLLRRWNHDNSDRLLVLSLVCNAASFLLGYAR